MNGNDPDQPEGSQPPEVDAAARLEQEQAELLSKVASATLNTTEARVAWILNNYPETRNSDIALQLAYWDTFEEGYHGGTIERDDLYRFARLTSLTRARAKIQNDLKLFQAAPEIRARRGKLSEEERERAVKTEPYPVFTVYADESGKTQQHYVVSSLWILHGAETFRLTKAFTEWRKATGFYNELHFRDLNDGNFARYQEAVEIVFNNASAVSFKSATVERAGAGSVQDAFRELFYQVTAGGIEHEDQTGRVPLPRTFQLWKDEEEAGYDKLVLAHVADRLTARFQNRLVIEGMRAVTSKGNTLLQIADLFAGAVNRVVNPPDPPPATPSAKDRFADYLLRRVGWAPAQGDLAVRLAI